MRPRRLPALWGALFLAAGGFLYLPIVMLVVFSFNDSPMLVLPLKGFTLKWYAVPWARRARCCARRATVCCWGWHLRRWPQRWARWRPSAIVRFRFRLRGAFLGVAAMPLVIPYVVLGVALLILFGTIGVPLSLVTVGVGHVIISVPYVLLIVAARLAGFPDSLEEAAQDLGATYWLTLWRVTLPISLPAIVAAFLTSFTTSFDEFAVSFFLTGTRRDAADLCLFAVALSEPAADCGDTGSDRHGGLGRLCCSSLNGCGARGNRARGEEPSERFGGGTGGPVQDL